MGSVEVAAISLPRETERFVGTWFDIYADEPHWVPPLYFERKRFFDPARNPYFGVAEVAYFIARRGGRDVGTIAVSVDAVYQEHEPGVAFFGFFQFVDDEEVAGALLAAAREWSIDRGMKSLVGPFDFNTNHEFGLLVDGFEHDPYVANPYNAAWYPRVYEAIGLRKAMDWYAYRVDAAMPGIQKMIKVSNRLMSRHPEIRLRPLDRTRFDEDLERVRTIYRDAWEENWAHVRLTDEEFDFIADGLKQLVDPDLCFIAEVGDRVAGISVTLPDFNRVVKRMNGRVLPFGWVHILRKQKLMDRVRIFMLGVAQEFQSLPLGAALYARTFEVALEKGYRYGEASLILENNTRMRGALEKMGATVEKTYRNYEIALQSEPVATKEGAP